MVIVTPHVVRRRADRLAGPRIAMLHIAVRTTERCSQKLAEQIGYSALTVGRMDRYTSICTSGSSSVVECFLAKEDVAGSTPVSRSSYTLVCDTLFLDSAGCA